MNWCRIDWTWRITLGWEPVWIFLWALCYCTSDLGKLYWRLLLHSLTLIGSMQWSIQCKVCVRSHSSRLLPLARNRSSSTHMWNLSLDQSYLLRYLSWTLIEHHFEVGFQQQPTRSICFWLRVRSPCLKTRQRRLQLCSLVQTKALRYQLNQLSSSTYCWQHFPQWKFFNHRQKLQMKMIS